MASIKKSKSSFKDNNNKLNIFNKNSSNQNLENANNKDNNSSNYIEKAFLADLLKCEICDNLFDLNIHIPMVVKCGHTFCKKCILEKNLNIKKSSTYGACPLDNIENIFDIESCIINLRVELLIKKIFSNISQTQSNEQNINQKQIVYSKPDIKKTKNITNNNQNIINNNYPNKNNNHVEYGYKKLEINSKKNYDINDNLSSPQIEEEMNINKENKFLFEDEKLNNVIINETIDTIPIFEEKSFCNVSFKEDVNELFAKNNVSNKNKNPLLTENIKKEINKNKFLTNMNSKKKSNKKSNELDLNQKQENPKLTQNFLSTPNKNKDNQLKQKLVKKSSNIYDKRNNVENKNIVLEREKDLAKYNINTLKIRKKHDKIQLKMNIPLIKNYNNYIIEDKNINENIIKNKDDLINNNLKNSNNNNLFVINKSKNENSKNKRDLTISTQYYPPKKIILFSNFTTYNNNNRYSTLAYKNDSNSKTSSILNKNANYLSTQILKKNNKTIEIKNDKNYEDLIQSANKEMKRHQINSNNNLDNENEILENKNRTYNSKKRNSIHNILLYNFMDNSKQKNINDLNKNLKLLNRNNRSNNNHNKNSSFSNSNSIYNKKKITGTDINSQNLNDNKEEKEDKEDSYNLIISMTQKDSNNIFKRINRNSKSQVFLLNDINNKNLKDKDEDKLKSSIEKKKNNLVSNSTTVFKKSKNTSPLIFSTKHTNKINIDINYNNDINKPKQITEFLLNEKNIRRANSFITNNKILNTTYNNSQNILTNNKSQNELSLNQLNNINCQTMPKKSKEELIQSLQNNLNSIIKKIKYKNNNISNLNEKKYHEMLDTILRDHNYENDLEKIKIKYFENKDFFIGIMEENNKYPHKGLLLSCNGDYYEGEFSKGKKEGIGKIIYKNKTSYEGTFKNNHFNGYGILIQLDGEIFKGEWKNGKINGEGIRFHSNGDKYIGSYVNNIRNGQGHYIFINGDSYDGNWVNGKANGMGTFKFRNGNIYEGEFKDNNILGKGILTMKNGDVYMGNFANGLLNGKGTYINIKEEKFVGNFEGGKKNGEGILYDKDGKIIKMGHWENDIFVNNYKDLKKI